MPQTAVKAPPAPPAPPGDAQNTYVVRPGSATPTAVFEAATAQRAELGEQLENLRHERGRITDELSNSETKGLDRTGLEARLTQVDARIRALDGQIAVADTKVSEAAAVPGAVAGHRAAEQMLQDSRRSQDVPEEAFVVGSLFIVVVFLPLSIAFARRIWRRSAAAVSGLPAELMERISHLDQAVESIAIEVERIGEGQRFMTRVMTDNNARAVGAGPAEPIRQPVRDAVPVSSSERQR